VQNVLWLLPSTFDCPLVGLFFFYSTARVAPEKHYTLRACRGSLFQGA